MTKGQMIKDYADTMGITHNESKEAWNAFEYYIKKHLFHFGGKFKISGFGTFYVTERKAHTARNPRTGEAVEVPTKKHLKFRPSDKLETELNN